MRFEYCLPLFFKLVLISLNDRAGNKPDLIHLRNIGGLGRVFTFSVEPVLRKMSVGASRKKKGDTDASHLGSFELSFDLLLLLVACKFGVLVINLPS